MPRRPSSDARPWHHQLEASLHTAARPDAAQPSAPDPHPRRTAGSEQGLRRIWASQLAPSKPWSKADQPGATPRSWRPAASPNQADHPAWHRPQSGHCWAGDRPAGRRKTCRLCADWKRQRPGAVVAGRTGLLLDPYFKRPARSSAAARAHQAVPLARRGALLGTSISRLALAPHRRQQCQPTAATQPHALRMDLERVSGSRNSVTPRGAGRPPPELAPAHATSRHHCGAALAGVPNRPCSASQQPPPWVRTACSRVKPNPPIRQPAPFCNNRPQQHRAPRRGPAESPTAGAARRLRHLTALEVQACSMPALAIQWLS